MTAKHGSVLAETHGYKRTIESVREKKEPCGRLLGVSQSVKFVETGKSPMNSSAYSEG
jgi:hypothetical protein